MKTLSFTGHSKDFSLQDALHDAAQQALGTAESPGVEFHVVSIRGRLGGPGRPRDLWVEIRLGQPGEERQDDTEERYTTMALGEEGGSPGDAEERYTTMALGEEGGVEQERPGVTTLALGEEGGEATL